MNAQTLNVKLAAYRARHKLSLQKMADLLKITSGSTINNWEHGDPIPGPPTMLLEWLIDGKVPFQELTVPPSVREEVWKVTMNLEAFERMDALRMAGGYASVTDFIAGLIQEELSQSAEGWEGATRTSDQGVPDGLALVADVTTEDAGGGAGTGAGTDDVGAHADAAARAFAKKHPLPPTGGAGAPAGTTAGRQDVTYKRLPRTSGTGVRKR